MNESFKKGDRVLSLDDPLKQGVVRNTLERYGKYWSYSVEVISLRARTGPDGRRRFVNWQDIECDLIVRWDGESESQYVKSEDVLPLLEESVRF